MGIKIIAKNKRAAFDFQLIEKFEAGIVLQGTEIKSLRQGKVSMNEAWIRMDKNGEAWIESLTIPQYAYGNVHNHDERRRRKLLLHRKELSHLSRETKAQSLVIIPTKLYLKKSRVKVEIALAKSRKKYDKRQEIARRDAERKIRRNSYD